MAIKKTTALTKEDFEEAIITLRLSISEVARGTGIPRQYLSHFRSYGDGLKPEQVAKLRDFLEARLAESGMSLEDDSVQGHIDPAEAYVIRPGETPLSDLDSRDDMARALLCVRHFALSPALNCEQITAALDRMDANDRKIGDIMAKPAKPAFLGDWSDETQADLQEVFGLLAENYILFRNLQGNSPVKIAAPGDSMPAGEPKTVAGIVAGLLAGSLGDMAGKITTLSVPEIAQEAYDDQPEEESEEGAA